MDMKEAMYQRHMVRCYMDKPLSADIVGRLETRMKENNEKYGVFVELKTEDTSAFHAVVRRIFAKGVRNFFIMAGNSTPNLEERLGYCGADLMLYAQTLGLNTWWVGGTFNKRLMTEVVSSDIVVGVIAVGYGQNQGVPHKTKTAKQVSSYKGEAPVWFKDGIEAALLAPTSLAKQAFMIKGRGNQVSISCKNGIFTGVDTGLVKYHFELGAGKDKFEWV